LQRGDGWRIRGGLPRKRKRGIKEERFNMGKKEPGLGW